MHANWDISISWLWCKEGDKNKVICVCRYVLNVDVYVESELFYKSIKLLLDLEFVFDANDYLFVNIKSLDLYCEDNSIPYYDGRFSCIRSLLCSCNLSKNCIFLWYQLFYSKLIWNNN